MPDYTNTGNTITVCLEFSENCTKPNTRWHVYTEYINMSARGHVWVQGDWIGLHPIWCWPPWTRQFHCHQQTSSNCSQETVWRSGNISQHVLTWPLEPSSFCTLPVQKGKAEIIFSRVLPYQGPHFTSLIHWELPLTLVSSVSKPESPPAHINTHTHTHKRSKPCSKALCCPQKASWVESRFLPHSAENQKQCKLANTARKHSTCEKLLYTTLYSKWYRASSMKMLLLFLVEEAGI